MIKRNPSLLPALLARVAEVEAEFVAAIAERTGQLADSAFTQLRRRRREPSSAP